MLSSLPPREREIVDILYERGASTVTEIGEALADPLSGSAIRAMLKRLEIKGFVVREASERGFVYAPRSDEHTSELQSLMRLSYAVFCLQKKIKTTNTKSYSRN